MTTKNGDGVGYKRPPRRNQFKKGRSGNPRGRSKGSKNLATLLDKNNSEQVTVTVNGRRRSIIKLEATIMHIVNRAASGDPKAIQQQIALTQWAEGRDEELAAPADPFTEDDRKVIEAVYARIKRIDAQGGGEPHG